MRLVFAFVFSIFIFPCGIKARMHQVTSATEIFQHIQKVLQHHSPEDVLVVLDVDMTLIQVAHPCDTYPALKKHKPLYKKFFRQATHLGMDVMASHVALSEKIHLVDSQWPSVINRLHQMKVPTIALTAILSHNPCLEPSQVHIHRKSQLSRVGISFQRPQLWAPSRHIFRDLPQWGLGHPEFHEGILYSNGTKHTLKGDVLVAYIRWLSEQTPGRPHNPEFHPIPKIIIFVDDRGNHLHDVRESIQKHLPNSTYVGLLFTGAYNYAQRIPSASEFTAYWQNIFNTMKTSLKRHHLNGDREDANPQLGR